MKTFREIEPVMAEIRLRRRTPICEADAAEAATREFDQTMDAGCARIARRRCERSIAADRPLDIEGAVGNGRGDDQAGGRRSSMWSCRVSAASDEVGEMAGAVEVFKTSMIETERLRAEQLETEQRQSQQRKADMHKLADDFEGAVGEIVETVSSASTELEASANTLTATAERSQQLATVVAAASEEASTNVQSVASATEEMTSSVNEISRQVQESARIASEAVEQAQQDQRPRQRTVEGRRADRRRRRTDQHHRRADQSAGAERHHRGGARRRSRPRLRGGRLRGEGAGRADRQGDRRDQPADHRHPGRDPGIGRGDQGDRRHHRPDVGDLLDHRVGGRRAGRGDPGDLAQRPAGRRRAPTQVSSNITDVQRGASETGSASAQVLSAAQSLSRDSNRLKLEVGKFLEFGARGLTTRAVPEASDTRRIVAPEPDGERARASADPRLLGPVSTPNCSRAQSGPASRSISSLSASSAPCRAATSISRLATLTVSPVAVMC